MRSLIVVACKCGEFGHGDAGVHWYVGKVENAYVGWAKYLVV